jgi:16S rRNA C1402 (ribose-2'-O) methylase RsmI
VVLAEDTRHTGKLLAAYGINATMQSYHAHNERGVAAKVWGVGGVDGRCGGVWNPPWHARHNECGVMALVSDAGILSPLKLTTNISALYLSSCPAY